MFIMTKLTKRKALEICRDLWTWIKGQEFKTGIKDTWPGWKANGGKISDMENYCPCCEYNITHIRRYCNSTCLLSCVWPNGCSDFPSPFVDFYNQMNKKKYAQEIIDACNKELAKLK